MDGRIFLIGGRQLSAIRTQDLPLLATAICGFERGLVHAERCYSKQVAYIRLFCKSFDIRVLASDWLKLLPYLSGQIDPDQPLPGPSNPLLVKSPPTTIPKDVSTIDQWDPVFYQKVYATLQILFTESYPTSKL